MAFPFGFEGFENTESDADLHPTHGELESYCERSFRCFAEVGQDEFMKIESHVSDCDSCQMALIHARIHLLNEKPPRGDGNT
jgi:NAD-dependent SIR2 family protein deacetylase